MLQSLKATDLTLQRTQRKDNIGTLKPNSQKSAIFPLIKCRSTYEKSMNGQSSNITGRHLLSLLHDFQNLQSGLKSVR